METTHSLRLCDDIYLPETPGINAKDLLGRWESSEAEPRGIDQIIFTETSDGIDAHILGAGIDGIVDWGIHRTQHRFANAVNSSQFTGVSFVCDLGSGVAMIKANLKLGVMVVGAHVAYPDTDTYRNFFFREFLAQTSNNFTPQIASLGGSFCQIEGLLQETSLPAKMLCGEWINTNASTKGVAQISLKQTDNLLEATVSGVGETGLIHWGSATGPLFKCLEEDGVPSAAALIMFDFEYFSCELQIRQNKGILAVTLFSRFNDDSGRSNYVTRELFYREGCLSDWS